MDEHPEQMSDDPLFTDVPSAERKWAMIAHLSPLMALLIPGMGLPVPLIVWLIKKDEMRFVNDQAKEALNFQLSSALVKVLVAIIGLPLVYLTFGMGVVLLIPLALLLGLVVMDIIMSIMAGVKVRFGEAYRYPHIIRFLK